MHLRPTLRAATTLERSHDGFDRLLQRIAEFHTGTIREIILIAATDRKDAVAFLDAVARLPLARSIQIVQASLVRLCGGFFPAAEDGAKPASSNNSIPLREFYRLMFRAATSALGWRPEEAWDATLTEINETFIGHLGTAQNAPVPEQVACNEAAGLDPEFDRIGLQALKAKYGKRRQ